VSDCGTVRTVGPARYLVIDSCWTSDATSLTVPTHDGA